MKGCGVYALTTLLTVLTHTQKSVAVTPASLQVDQVVDWFTGNFDNAQQVEESPFIPLVAMSNCTVDVEGFNEPDTQVVYLEQSQNSIPFRVRSYFFSPDESGVELSIRSFADTSGVEGICNEPEAERTFNIENVLSESCELSLVQESNKYVGTNTPVGCPTSFPGGKVLSEVVIQANQINSLDQIFSANGTLLFGSRIEFERVSSSTTVSEPTGQLGLVALGVAGISVALKRTLSER